MLTIWGRINSHNTKKVVWAAIEAGIAWERREMGGEFGYTDDYLAMNPNRLVPTITDTAGGSGDFALYESNAILRYIAAAYAPALIARDPRDYARGEMWMDWHFQYAGAQRDAFLGCVRQGKDASDPRVARSGAAAAALMGQLDAELARRDWLAGPAFGIADIPMGVYARTFFALPIERPHLPNLAAWYARLAERPGFQTIAEVPLT